MITGGNIMNPSKRKGHCTNSITKQWDCQRREEELLKQTKFEETLCDFTKSLKELKNLTNLENEIKSLKNELIVLNEDLKVLKLKLNDIQKELAFNSTNENLEKLKIDSNQRIESFNYSISKLISKIQEIEWNILKPVAIMVNAENLKEFKGNQTLEDIGLFEERKLRFVNQLSRLENE